MAPLTAPSKLCLNTPLDLREGFGAWVVVGALLKGFLGLGIFEEEGFLGLGIFEVEGVSFLMPDVEGVAGSCLILVPFRHCVFESVFARVGSLQQLH